jgi:hypothetical protein
MKMVEINKKSRKILSKALLLLALFLQVFSSYCLLLAFILFVGKAPSSC